VLVELVLLPKVDLVVIRHLMQLQPLVAAGALMTLVLVDQADLVVGRVEDKLLAVLAAQARLGKAMQVVVGQPI
jgi:hypothetical protein